MEEYLKRDGFVKHELNVGVDCTSAGSLMYKIVVIEVSKRKVAWATKKEIYFIPTGSNERHYMY